MGSNLVLHCGAGKATLEQVAAVVTPPGTDSWKPVPHAEVIQEIKAEVLGRGLEVRKEGYGLTRDGARMFGVIDTTDPEMPGGIGIALGFRNSHDRAWSLGVCGGTRVFVCDNLAFSGEVVRYRKHTSGIKTCQVVLGVMDVILNHVHQEADWLGKLRSADINDTQAKALVMDLWDADALPQKMVLPVWQGYKQAGIEGIIPGFLKSAHGEDGVSPELLNNYRPRTLWSLYQTVTEHYKALRNDNNLRRSGRLNQVFGRMVPRNFKALPADAVEQAPPQ